MNVASTDVLSKCNTIFARLKKLLRFVALTGLAMLAMIAVYLATDQPITRSGCGIASFMLVMLTAASVFNFDWWFVGPLLNVGALFSTPALLGREFSASLVALVGVVGLVSIAAALGYTALRRRRWEEEAGTPPDQRSGMFLEAPVPPEKRRFRITHLGRAERSVIKYPTHASIFGLMNAAKKAWTMYDVQRLELALWQGRPYAEIASRKGLTGREVSNGVRGALERLNRHLCRDSNDDEDHLDRVLLALNECRSVGRAAKKLEVSKDVLQAFIERAGIKSRIVFEVEP